MHITELSGLIELACREESTTEKLPVSDINIIMAEQDFSE